jgi:hypothetical protein
LAQEDRELRFWRLVAIDASAKVGESTGVPEAHNLSFRLFFWSACDASASLRRLLGSRPPLGEFNGLFATQLLCRCFGVGHHVGFFVAHSSLVLFVMKDFRLQKKRSR